MIYLGLTGSICMGKSTTAKLFAAEGVPVYDADASVHTIYAKGGSAVGPVGEMFPEVIVDGQVDRAMLRERVMKDRGAMKELEQTVHPLVGKEQLKFRERVEKSNAFCAVLDIPLLYENRGERSCNFVVVVTAPAEIQKTRFLERPGVTEKDLEGFLAKQLPDKLKREKADFIINTSFGIEYAQDCVGSILSLMQRLSGSIN